MATVPTPTTEDVLTTPYYAQGATALPKANARTITVTMPGYSTLGNAIVVNIFLPSAGGQAHVQSVTDNYNAGVARNVWNPNAIGNVYNLQQSFTSADGIAYVYVATNIFQFSDPQSPGFASYLAVTVNFDAVPSYFDIEILEYGNVTFTQTLLHAVNSFGSGVTSISAPSVNTLVPNELLVSYVFSSGAGTLTQGSAWGYRLTNTKNGGAIFSTSDQLADVPGAYQASWSNTASGDFVSLVTGLAAGSPLTTVMQRAIGDTYSNIVADIGQPSVALLTKGARAADAIPSNMLNLYKQIYQMAASMPTTTGLSYTESLASGGSLPYTGQGS